MAARADRAVPLAHAGRLNELLHITQTGQQLPEAMPAQITSVSFPPLTMQVRQVRSADSTAVVGETVLSVEQPGWRAAAPIPVHANDLAAQQALTGPYWATDYPIYNTYAVWFVFDAMIVLGTVLLLVCYAIARAYNHVGVFCDISDLVINMPERVLFRFNFGLCGCTLCLIAFPVKDIAARRVSGKMPNAASFFQKLSGVGMVFVGGCGPTECQWFHIFAAILAFAGSGIAQILYAIVFYQVDQPSPRARRLYVARNCISAAFFVCAVVYILTNCDVVPEPAGHITEWGMWFFLLLWYWTFRLDMTGDTETFYIATLSIPRDNCQVSFS